MDGFISLWRSPSKAVLLGLAGAVGVLGFLSHRSESVAEFLNSHNFRASEGKVGFFLVGFWFALYVLNESWVRLVAILDHDKWIQAQNANARKIAGNIDKISEILASHGRRLPEAEARQIVCSFLARIVSFASLVLADDDVSLRACCYRAHDDLVDGPIVQAWVYDAPHHHAGTRRLKFGMPLAGKIAQDKKSYLVDDTTDPEIRALFGDTPYRSVIGFPLLIGTKKVVGVVTLDATKPGVFSAPNLGQRLEDGTSPILAAIALAVDAVP